MRSHRLSLVLGVGRGVSKLQILLPDNDGVYLAEVKKNQIKDIILLILLIVKLLDQLHHLVVKRV